MIKTVEGIFRDGKVELLETPESIDGARVFVTFLPLVAGPVEELSFTPDEIADLRAKLAAWEEDWQAPGMEAYDDYEARRRVAPSPAVLE
jgi:hypothetical protein